MGEFYISEFEPGNEQGVQCLVRTVFDEFVAPGYAASGNTFFYEYIEAAGILARFRSGNLFLTARSGDSIIGIIEVRDCYHICLLFVDKTWQGKGVARALLKKALERCRLSGSCPGYIEVNASPFSEVVYRKLGFIKTEELQEVNGMKFVPMRMTHTSILEVS